MQGAAVNATPDTGLAKGFGSFQSPDVEALISQPESDYVAPGILEERGNGWIEEVEEKLARGELECGDGCKELFLIDFDSWTFLSHGALGGVLKPVYEDAKWWRDLCELQPLKFVDRNLLPLLVHVIREMASFVGCRPTDLCLLPNATAGLNVVISGIGAHLKPGESVFLLSISYAATKKIVESLCLKTGAHMIVADVKYPPSGPEEIIRIVEENIPPTAKLAIFDVVTSGTAMALPISALVQLCRKRSRGAAILYVKANMKKFIKPFIVSHGSGHGFTSEFIWDGNRDYSPYLSLLSAVKFWKAFGLERAWSYIDQTIANGVKILVGEWGTETLLSDSLKCRSMTLVRLPKEFLECSFGSSPAGRIQNALHYEHRIEAPVKSVDGELYIRVSVHIYTTVEDFKKLAKAISSIALSVKSKK